MGLLDASLPQLQSSHASFTDQATQFMALLHQQEATAQQALAVNGGSNSLAYQGTMAQMYDSGNQLQALLHTAGTNIGDAQVTYLTQDANAADATSGIGGMIPGGGGGSMPTLNV
ncbi:hypothetical protein [Mycobacterium sp.]|uniref:hypothetical protein n=1 Tax=Mycobacterium sp. TaxID=1785 RepID=UPI0025CCF2CE|nr:hypothetical protein [Mycobacterium sp.]